MASASGFWVLVSTLPLQIPLVSIPMYIVGPQLSLFGFRAHSLVSVFSFGVAAFSFPFSPLPVSGSSFQLLGASFKVLDANFHLLSDLPALHAHRDCGHFRAVA